ncbi:MAG: RDD family protein [Myxococcales bacterium]|nr:RDD family protein [Myxococcales bacterium]
MSLAVAAIVSKPATDLENPPLIRPQPHMSTLPQSQPPVAHDSVPPAAQTLRWRRAAARGIDSLVALVLIPTLIGSAILGVLPFPRLTLPLTLVVMNVWYLCSDAIPLGKRFLRLAVVERSTGAPCTLGQSFTRNLTFGVTPALQGLIGVGFGSWNAFKGSHPQAAMAVTLIGLAVALIEANRVDKGRLRLGDEWAGTTVVDTRIPRVPRSDTGL